MKAERRCSADETYRTEGKRRCREQVQKTVAKKRKPQEASLKKFKQ